MTVKITPNDKGNPPGKLADAEIHFTDGPLEGLKLIGFSVWELKRAGGVGKRPFHRRLDLIFHTVFNVAVVDGNDGDALVEKGSRIGFLVAALPTASMDVKDDRRRFVRFRLIEI